MARAHHTDTPLTKSPGKDLALFLPREHGSWGLWLTVLLLPPAALVPVQAAAAFGGVIPGGWGLTGLVLAFFLRSGLRIRSLVRARRADGFRPVSLAVHFTLVAAAVLAALGPWLPPLAPVALVPGLLQSWRILQRGAVPVSTQRMGIGEILHNTVFVILAVVAYRSG